ncbi:hypothetical protein C8R47DRAFT_128963 [Mycena vitilis]|nr:hypothetical protein C8R47DRAFT_128963 [Mycena vitilis]
MTRVGLQVVVVILTRTPARRINWQLPKQLVKFTLLRSHSSHSSHSLTHLNHSSHLLSPHSPHLISPHHFYPRYSEFLEIFGLEYHRVSFSVLHARCVVLGCGGEERER